MNENLDLVEVLKDTTKGTKLYSPIFGEVILLDIDKTSSYPIRCKIGNEVIVSFSKKGDTFHRSGDSECLLFPSKEQRDWSKFNISKTHHIFEHFQPVIAQFGGIWCADFYSHYDDEHNKHCLLTMNREDGKVLPYEGNEELLGKPIKGTKYE